MKKRKLAIIIPCAVVGAISLAVAIPFTILGIRTAGLKSDYKYLAEDSTYSSKVEVEGINLVTQHISCGYASIEMLSSYYGNKVSEDDLEAKNNGAISTASSGGFLKEINASIPEKSFEIHAYLKNDQLLKEIHISLSNNNPVAIEWAAQYEGEWTLHFSVVSGLDLANDNITVLNPYGYIEDLKIEEFLDRTSFNAYKNLPLFLNFGFAYGAFDKNVIFFVK